MKRLVFFFDGTWQKLAGIPTNVVLTAASIERLTGEFSDSNRTPLAPLDNMKQPERGITHAVDPCPTPTVC